jgi:fused signal recognition particle receptor
MVPAKGGVVIGISDQFQIQLNTLVLVRIEDLQVFNKYGFVDSFFK